MPTSRIADAMFLRARADYAFKLARIIEQDATNVVDVEMRRRLNELADQYVTEGVGFQSSAALLRFTALLENPNSEEI